MWFAPMLEGYIPVTMAARLGAQTPEGEKTFGYRMPSFAKRLRFGVRTVLSPKEGRYCPMSSVTNHNILGFFGMGIVFSPLGFLENLQENKTLNINIGTARFRINFLNKIDMNY